MSKGILFASSFLCIVLLAPAALDPVQVTVPTLLIHGEFDPYAPIERQMMFFALLGTSDKQWVVVPGGDHAAFLETPRAYFISTLVNFIERPR